MRQLLSVALSLGMLTTVSSAFADIQACLAASERGQRARAEGKLREARENFVICGAESCPGLVRHDCAQWNAELAAAMPSVVFGARDSRGRDLFDVNVTMDGQPLLNKLDGKSVPVDPGKHTFRFEAAGLRPVTEVVLVKEGERARVVNITFDAGPTPLAPSKKEDKPSSGRHTVFPWIVVGAGVAGVAAGAVLVLTTPDRPPNCNADTQKCTRIEGQSDEDFRTTRERAGTADSQPLLGYAVMGAGAAVMLSGLVWHFLEPTRDVRSGARIMPWTTAKASGVALGLNF